MSHDGCPVCFHELKGDWVLTLECGHTFHKGCIMNLDVLNCLCPICRKQIEVCIICRLPVQKGKCLCGECDILQSTNCNCKYHGCCLNRWFEKHRKLCPLDDKIWQDK